MMKVKDGKNFLLKITFLCFLSISLSSQNLHSMCDAYREDLENYEISARSPTVSPLISRDFIKNKDGETEDEVIKDIINGKKAAITVCTTPLRSYLIGVDHVSLVFELVMRPKEGQADPSQPLRLFNIHFGGDGDSESIDEKCPIIDNACNTLRKVLRGQRTFITGEEPEDVHPIYTRQMVFIVDQVRAQKALEQVEKEDGLTYHTIPIWHKWDNCCTYAGRILRTMGIEVSDWSALYTKKFVTNCHLCSLPEEIIRYNPIRNALATQESISSYLCIIL